MNRQNNPSAFSVLALLVRPAQTAPAMLATSWAFSTLVIGMAIGTVMVLGAARHVGLGAALQVIDVLFVAALVAPLVGYGGLLLSVRLALLMPGARATGVQTGELAQLFGWCMLPPLLVSIAVLAPLLTGDGDGLRGTQSPLWGGGAAGVAAATLLGVSLAWAVWLMTSAASARLALSKPSSLLLVSSTIAVLVVIYALLVVLLMTLVS